MRTYIIALLSGVLLVGWLTVVSTAHAGVGTIVVVDSPADVPADALTDGPVTNPDTCETTQSWVLTIPATDDTVRKEYRYKKWVPAIKEESYLKYKYKKTVVTPGQAEVTEKQWRWLREAKDVKGWKHHNGSWVQADGWHKVPDHLIEAANFDPRNVAPTGNVNLSAYGGPSVSVPYSFSIQGPSDYTTNENSPYGAGSIKVDIRTVVIQEAIPETSKDYFTGWTREVHTAPWVEIDRKKVVIQEAKPGYWIYYVLGSQPSLNRSSATWINKERAPQGWQVFDKRTKSNKDGTPEQVTTYIWSDGGVCDEPETPVETPEVPEDDEWTKEETPELPLPPKDIPDEPKEKADKPEPKTTSSQTVVCVGGALITKTADADGNIESSTVNGHPDCDQVDDEGEYFAEEGF